MNVSKRIQQRELTFRLVNSLTALGKNGSAAQAGYISSALTLTNVGDVSRYGMIGIEITHDMPYPHIRVLWLAVGCTVNGSMISRICIGLTSIGRRTCAVAERQSWRTFR
jgi:hypothetical protein